MSERPPEVAGAAEKAVLGACLVDEGAARRAMLSLAAGDFYHERHRHVFQAVADLLASGPDSKCDLTLVVEELRRRGQLGDCGGPTYLSECLQAVSSASYVDQYAAQVLKASLDRQVQVQLMVAAGDDTPENVEKLRALVMRREGASAIEFLDFQDVKQLTDAVEGLLTRMAPAIPTGFEELDQWVGLRPGDLVTVGSRTGGGKTAFMTRMALNIAERQVPTTYVTTEMSRAEMLFRILPAAAGVPAWKLLKRACTPQDVRAVSEAVAGYLSKLPLKVYSHLRPRIGDITSAALRSECKALFFDYVQRADFGAEKAREPRTYQIQEFMIRLKNFSMQAGIFTVMGCQLDRQRDKNAEQQPTLSDLKDSASIEAESTHVMLLWTNRKDEGPIVRDGCVGLELINAKNRNGQGGHGEKAYLELDREFVRVCSRSEAAPRAKPAQAEEPPAREEWWDR